MPACRRIALVAVAVAAAIGAMAGFLQRNALGEFLFATLARNLDEAGTPLGGERVLPPPVQQMIAMLRRQQVDRYRISPAIARDFRYHLSITEAAWPIRLAIESPWYLALADETLPAGCESVDLQEDAVLARCP